MMHEKSEIDDSSLGDSISPSCSSPKHSYYVQSSSRDSHDDQSSTNSRHSTPIEFSLVGKHHPNFLRKKKGWSPLFSVIDEEDEDYGDDDLIPDKQFMRQFRFLMLLIGEFAMTNIGSLNYFLSISAQRSASGLFLSHMQNCNPCRTPVDTESKLGSDGDTVSDPTLYRSIAGALHFMYTDAEGVGCPVTRRSTFGYCVFLGDNLLSWSAKRQVILSRSSAEAEYPGVANVVVETAWIRNLLCDLHTPLFTATLVYYNNVSVVYMSANPVQHQRTKHIEIDIHFVRDFFASGQVRVLHVPSRFQYADIFTKGLPTTLFLEFRSRTFEDLFQLSLILIDISNCHEVSFLIDCLCDKYH
ncbi:ribonuclease H-like domain-containing protein [Tanacetum coccineum]